MLEGGVYEVCYFILGELFFGNYVILYSTNWRCVMKRSKMNYKKSKKLFTATAKGAHKRNFSGPMRGGIRL